MKLNIAKFLLILVALVFSRGGAAATTYTYDVLNRLTAVSYTGGGGLTYSYDAAGNRLSRVSTSAVVSNYALTVNLAGAGSGRVSGSGIDCGSTCSASYASGTSVTLTATPAAGSTFAGWSGACSGTSSCTVSMSAAQGVTASFALGNYGLSNLLVNPGFESGASSWTQSSGLAGYSIITNDPSLARTGSYFAWLGGYDSGSDSIYQNVTIPANAQTAYVQFWYRIATSELSVDTAWDKMVVDLYNVASGVKLTTLKTLSNLDSTSGAWVQSAQFDVTAYKGQTVQLRFTSTGDASDSTSFMLDDVSLTASVAPGNYTLSLTKSGTGTGTVTSSPAGISCGATCSASYSSGTSVTLTATPATGSTFAGWSGACSGTGSCLVSMSQAQNVTATFTINSYTLSVTKSGTGSGTVTATNLNCGSLCSASFTSGTSVTLTATADSGSTFADWSGACSGTAATCTVSMNQAQSVTATFALATVSTVSPYDGIYQWDDGYYLSVHQIGGGTLIGTIYWVYTANTEQVGTRPVSEADTFDLSHGQLVGSTATMTGTRFYRACTLSYDFTFNPDSSLTVSLNSVSNSPGVSVADVDCAARYNTVGSVRTIPRIY